MEKKTLQALFDSYCYGPVDLIQLRKGDSTMWLVLKDTAGKRAEAVYHDCVYWRIGPEQAGTHLSYVQRVSAGELQSRKGSISLQALQRNACNVDSLLQDWEEEGLSFYLHIGNKPDQEYLVVARSLEYREKE